MRRQRVIFPSVAFLLALATFSACASDGRTLRPADPSQNASVFAASTTTTIVVDIEESLATDPIDTAIDAPGTPFVIRTPWPDGGNIATRYTCNGEGVSPAISWTGVPSNAVSLALVVTDTDSGDFVNWVIAGLDPNAPGLLEGQVPLDAIEAANGASTDDAPSIGWKQPCPPPGTTHHYRFAVYALDQQVELATGSPAADLITVIDSSAIQAAQITGVYTTP